MRSLRFLLPFTLGALCMLAVVLAAGWAAPGVFGRVNVALGWAPAPVAAPSPAPVIAVAPPIVAPAVAVVPAPTTAAADVPVTAAPPEPIDAAAPGAVRLLIPVQGVAAASLVNSYDQARGQGRRHDAIDIMAPRGTPVVATSDGVVMKLFQSERGGITLYELAPDRRTIYYYAHLDRYAPGMVEGRALRRGDVLGYVGNTGDAGPGNYHLHFEVSTTADPRKYWGGISQNPYPLLR
jgi:murein DD-endopeptidase MepM/ murein hydrolase activator NlpD